VKGKKKKKKKLNRVATNFLLRQCGVRRRHHLLSFSFISNVIPISHFLWLDPFLLIVIVFSVRQVQFCLDGAYLSKDVVEVPL